MKTLAVLSQKGGSGKSTLAVHLAAVAQEKHPRTTIIDLDPQASVAGWGRKRHKPHPEVLETEAQALRAALASLRAEGTEFCVIDTRPSTTADVVAAAAQADVVIIPTRPAVFDLEAIEKTVAIVVQVKRPAWIVLNAVPAGRKGDEAGLTKEARAALRGYHIRVARVSIGQRTSLQAALMHGDAVHEVEPRGKAAAEVKALWRFLEKQLWP